LPALEPEHGLSMMVYRYRVNLKFVKIWTIIIFLSNFWIFQAICLKKYKKVNHNEPLVQHPHSFSQGNSTYSPGLKNHQNKEGIKRCFMPPVALVDFLHIYAKNLDYWACFRSL
jgi:hypothetical protein